MKHFLIDQLVKFFLLINQMFRSIYSLKYILKTEDRQKKVRSREIIYNPFDTHDI